jgi:hypothetical protein
VIRVPDPGEWHPRYEPVRLLLTAWLHQCHGQYLWGKPVTQPVCYIPVAMSWNRWLSSSETETAYTDELPVDRLDFCMSRGLAPYASMPFIYEWATATDTLGRSITLDSYRISMLQRHLIVHGSLDVDR